MLIKTIKRFIAAHFKDFAAHRLKTTGLVQRTVHGSLAAVKDSLRIRETRRKPIKR